MKKISSFVYPLPSWYLVVKPQLIKKTVLQKQPVKIRMVGSTCMWKGHLLISLPAWLPLANDIDTSIQAVSFLLQHDTHRDWQFYRNAARNFLWTNWRREYKDEINGIVEGLQAQKKKYDSLDITAYNAMEELAYYYVPMLDNQLKPEAAIIKLGNWQCFYATAAIPKMER